MEGIDLIQDLAITLLAAGIAGVLCKRAGLSVIVGYLLAGIVIGPYTPPFSLITDVPRIETLSQVGLTFLMFSIGLGFSLTKLRQMGAGAFVATILAALLVFNFTQLIGLIAGWSHLQGLFVAAIFMVSSSAVVAKVVRELNLDHDRTGQLAVGVTVNEDVVAVVMLAVLAGQSAAGAASVHLGSLVTGLIAFVALLLVSGLLFVPRLLRRMELAHTDPELRTLLVAGLLFLMALVAVKAGYSLALGAFLLGAIVAEMPQKPGIEKAFAGTRDMFSSVFFVSIGMMIDVRLFGEVWPAILGLGLLMIAVRVVAVWLALIAVGEPSAEARRAGLMLIPIGEFSFLTAQMGVKSGALPAKAYPVVVGISILTVFVTPFLNQHAGPLLRGCDRLEPGWFKRGLDAWHRWLAQLAGLGHGRRWWELGRHHVILLTLHLLLLTGLTTFSELIFRSIQQSPLAANLDPLGFKVIFWVVFGCVLLIPLIALWRALSALATLFARTAAERLPRLPVRPMEACAKVLGGAGLAYYLSQVLPVASLARWLWLVILAVAGGVVFVFYRRLAALNENWQSDLTAAFDGGAPATPEGTAALGSQPWVGDARSWDLNVQECVLPERAACAGRTLGELDVRARFGCSVVEIDRQGTVLIAPDLATRLYAGDRLLLLGRSENLGRARADLSAGKTAGETHSIDECRLESVAVPATFAAALTVAEMQDAAGSHVLVVGIERAGVRHVNPVGADPIRPSDLLLVLGEPDKVQALRRWLASRSE
ncbi:sodium/hydrogen exchanger [Opitutaceae bacterium TAV5]|nr:sodium/hydrogen exchanger [Opitutaceae bacterium TAV5]